LLEYGKKRDRRPWDFCYSLDKCRGMRLTESALLVSRGEKSFWVPLRVIHKDSRVLVPGNSGTLIVALWFAISPTGMNLKC